MKSPSVLFLCIFVSVILTFSQSLSLMSNKSVMMNLIKSGMKQSFTNPNISEQIVKLLPSLRNKGFKCLKVDLMSDVAKPLIGIEDPVLCARQGESCVSKGIVIYMIDEIYDIMVLDAPAVVMCDIKLFKINSKNSEEGLCYTQSLKVTKYKSDEIIPQNVYSNRVCKYHKDNLETEYTLFTQDDTITCKQDGISQLKKIWISKQNSNSKSIDPNYSCFCHNIIVPKLNLSSFYFPVRFSNSEFECLKDYNEKCFATLSQDKCYSFVTEKSNCCSISIKDVAYLKYLVNYFFSKDKWICPSETGLSVALKYEITKANNKDALKVSCLGRTGADCFYEENAENACQRINSLKEAKTEFNSLACGSSEYKQSWFNDGYNIPMNSWCKHAIAWLTYNGKITEVRNTPIVMCPWGNYGCLPNPLNANMCLTKSTTGVNYADEISNYYKNESDRFNELIFCGKTEMKFVVGSNTNVCNFQVDHDQGRVFIAPLSKELTTLMQ